MASLSIVAHFTFYDPSRGSGHYEKCIEIRLLVRHGGYCCNNEDIKVADDLVCTPV